MIIIQEIINKSGWCLTKLKHTVTSSVTVPVGRSHFNDHRLNKNGSIQDQIKKEFRKVIQKNDTYDYNHLQSRPSFVSLLSINRVLLGIEPRNDLILRGQETRLVG